MPPRPRAPQGKSSSHSRSKVAKSLQEIYEDSCRDEGVHPNSTFFRLLPDKPGVLLLQDSLDLHRNYVGNRGIVPVLAVIQRCPQIKRLILTENGLRNSAVEAICHMVAKHGSITSIDLSDNYISEGAAVALEQLLTETPRITDVGLVNTKIDAETRLKLKNLAGSNQASAAANAASSAR